MVAERILMKPEDQVTRKVKLKGQVVQIAQPPLQPKEESPFIQSKYLPSNVTLKNIHRSMKFVPVLIFIPAPIEGAQVSLHRLLGEGSLDQIDGRKLAELLEK